jgi:hypothetical protein
VLGGLVISVCLPVTSSAAIAWSSWTEIKQVYPQEVALTFNTTYLNPLSLCENGTRWVLNPGNPDYSTQAGALLAAFMAGKEIRFAYEDTQEPSCNPTVTRFRIKH